LLQIFLISFSFDKLANKLAQDTSVCFLSISNKFVLSSHNGAEVGPSDVGEEVGQLEQVLTQFVITILLLLQIFLISFSFDKLANKLAQDTSVCFLSISNKFVLSSHNGAELGLLVGTLVGYGVGLIIGESTGDIVELPHAVHVL